MDKEALIEQIKAFPFAVICALLAIVSGAVLFLRGGAADELSIVESDLLSRIRIIDRNAKNSVSLQQDLKTIEGIVENIDSRLFDRDERAININFFYGFEHDFDVVFTSISQMNGSDPIYSEKGPRVLKEYSTLVYDIVLTGTFGNVVRLIEELARVEPMIRVADYSLVDVDEPERPDGVDGRLRVIVLGEKD